MGGPRGRRAQEPGVELCEVHGAQLLHTHGTDMRDDIEPEDLPVALKRLRADIQAHPVAVPALGKLGKGFL